MLLPVQPSPVQHSPSQTTLKTTPVVVPGPFTLEEQLQGVSYRHAVPGIDVQQTRLVRIEVQTEPLAIGLDLDEIGPNSSILGAGYVPGQYNQVELSRSI